MAKYEKIVNGRKYVIFPHVAKSKRNNGGRTSIKVQFTRKDFPHVQRGYPEGKESERKTILRLFNNLRTEILGGKGSPGLADEAQWVDKKEIELFFDEYHTMLKSQPVEA